MPDKEEGLLQRICFRGDSRQPDYGENMFRRGFQSREPDSKIKYIPGRMKKPIHREHAKHYRAAGIDVFQAKKRIYDAKLDTNVEVDAGMGREFDTAGDIENFTAVCVTPRFSMAPLFPGKKHKNHVPPSCPEYTWVYALWVERGFNTHGHQVAEGLKAVGLEMDARARIMSDPLSWRMPQDDINQFLEDSALWPLYAHELATKTIPARHVLCALKVRRVWRGDDWTSGCTYHLAKGTVKWNRRARVDRSVMQSVKTFLEKEPITGTTPSRSSGFQKSTRR